VPSSLDPGRAGLVARLRAAHSPAANAGRRFAAAATLCIAALVGVAPEAQASDWLAFGDQLRITYGPSAFHFSGSDEHVRFNHLLSAELLTHRWTFWGADRTQIGFAAFDNSFGQFSQYLYAGQEWDMWRIGGGDVFVNVTAGLLHGYKDEYKDKIPFNNFGIAPVIIPSIGWRYQRFSILATVLGTNGFLFAASWTFDLKP
jgi:hypothetical protein